jgi:hypothetical protein
MPEVKGVQVIDPSRKVPVTYKSGSVNPDVDLVCVGTPDAVLRLRGGKDGPAVIIETNGKEIDLVKHIKTTRALVWGLFFAMVPLALAVVLLSFRLS